MSEVEITGGARNWVFTWNNYSPDWRDKLQTWATGNASYIIAGAEVAPTTGTPHIQGYVEFSGTKRLSTIVKETEKLGMKFRLDRAKGSALQNKIYCSKEAEDEVFTMGMPKKKEQGKRNDLVEVKNMIRSGASELEVADSHFNQWVRYNRSFSQYRNLVMQEAAKRERNVRVYYIWGETGTGKSRYCRDRSPGLFSVSEGVTGMWFTGYAYEKEVLFDDFRGTVPLHVLLKYLDRYPVQVPIHGSYMHFNAEVIYITSNVPLEDLYRNADQRSRDALRRRITEVIEMTNGTSDKDTPVIIPI